MGPGLRAALIICVTTADFAVIGFLIRAWVNGISCDVKDAAEAIKDAVTHTNEIDRRVVRLEVWREMHAENPPSSL